MSGGKSATRSQRAYLCLGSFGVRLMVQYYTLEQAAKVLRIDPEQLKEMARKKEIRAFQDRSGWRFRAQEIDEMARERGFGSDPELPLGEAAKVKPGDSSGEVFNFSLEADDSDEVALGNEPISTEKPSSRPGSGSKKPSGSKSPPPKASSDSDVRLVLEGSDVDFSIDPEDSKAPASKAPVSPPPKIGSSKSRGAPPVQEDSGVRIVPLDQPSDSDVKIVPASPHDSDVPVSPQRAKKKSDSDIRVEEMAKKKNQDQLVTEEIDLDAEERKAAEARAKATKQKPKPGSSPILPAGSPFELSEKDAPPRKPGRASAAAEADSDSSSDFELRPMADSSSPLEVGSDELAALRNDDEVGLGELNAGKGATGINLQDPADSGISLEQESSDEMQFDLSLDNADKASATPTPAEAKSDSSSDFELSVPEETSSPTEGSSSDFELSLQEEDASPTEGTSSSSEFELSLDPEAGDLVLDEGSSDLALEPPGTDSDSEFELTLDEGGGLSVEEEGAAEGEESVFETDFEVPSMDEESGSDAVALDETGLESSEFDLSVEGEESGSQVVPLEDEEEYDEGADTVQRKRRPAAAEGEEELEDLGEALDEDLDEEPALEEEEEAAAVAAAPEPPADWGIAVPLASLACTVILFLVSLMSFELIQGMWGYHTGNKVSSPLVRFFAKTFSGEDNLPDY